MKIPVSKPAILTNLQFLKLTEVVSVQLNKIGDDRLLIRQGGDHFNLSD